MLEFPRYYICAECEQYEASVLVRIAADKYYVLMGGEDIDAGPKGLVSPWTEDCHNACSTGQWLPVDKAGAVEFLDAIRTWRDVKAKPGPNFDMFTAAALTGLLANRNVIEGNSQNGWGPRNTTWAGIVEVAREIGAIAAGGGK